MKNIPTAWCCHHHLGMVFSGWWEVLGLRQTAFSWWPKSHFSLIWPEYLLPYVWGVSHMPFGEHQTCLLFFFFKQWLFFWSLFRKAQLCGVCGLKWSYGQILQSPLWSFAGLSLVSLLPLINALLAWTVSFGGQHSLGRFVVVPYSFLF